jgi:O-antigen ligase
LLLLVWQRARTAGGIGLFVPLSPVIAVMALGFLADSKFGGVLSRGNGDVSTGNSRFTIWSAIFHFLREPHVEHLYGYGAYGQLASNVVYSYSYIFGRSLQPIYEHAHNLALQTILDYGYVCLVTLALLIVFAVLRLERLMRLGTVPVFGPLAALLVVAMSGMTEAFPSYFSLDTVALFVMLAAAATAPTEVAATATDDG